MIRLVLDLVSQFCDVVLEGTNLAQENPRKSGFWNGEGMGRGWKRGDQFTSNLRPRWTGSYHSKEGFQVSKVKWEGGKKESERGKQKARGLRHNCVVNLYACT